MKNYLQSSGVIFLKDQECLVGFCSSSLLDPLNPVQHSGPHLEIGCATHGIPAPTEGACGMQTFFPADKAFLDIFISSKNMLFLGSTLCVMSMMVNSTKILIMLMDD